MHRSISAVLLALLCMGLSACPKQARETPGSVRHAVDEAERSADAPTLKLQATELKVGQRIVYSVPTAPQTEGCFMQILKQTADEQGIISEETLDSFAPHVGADTEEGWMPPGAGTYVLRLMDAGGTLLTESTVSVSAWPMGDPLTQTMPYVTINDGEVSADMKLKVGLPLVAYYKVPDDFPREAWIGLFRSDAAFDGSATADDAVDSTIISGSQGQFTFFPKEPGRYVVRLFSSHTVAASHCCDSQEIEVVAEY